MRPAPCISNLQLTLRVPDGPTKMENLLAVVQTLHDCPSQVTNDAAPLTAGQVLSICACLARAAYWKYNIVPYRDQWRTLFATLTKLLQQVLAAPLPSSGSGFDTDVVNNGLAEYIMDNIRSTDLHLKRDAWEDKDPSYTFDQRDSVFSDELVGMLASVCGPEKADMSYRSSQPIEEGGRP